MSTKNFSLDKKTKELEKIRDEVIDLMQSPLYEYRTRSNYHAVLGEGSQDANIMFVGEAPGRNEAESGRPFCGRAGKILDDLLESINLNREDVYITNIVKDRPPENRDPTLEEIELYAPYLDRQILIIEPTVLVPLGRHAMNYVLNKYNIDLEPISKAHGKIYHATGLFGDIKIIPMYHPAAIIYTQSLLETVKDDFKTLNEYI